MLECRVRCFSADRNPNCDQQRKLTERCECREPRLKVERHSTSPRPTFIVIVSQHERESCSHSLSFVDRNTQVLVCATEDNLQVIPETCFGDTLHQQLISFLPSEQYAVRIDVRLLLVSSPSLNQAFVGINL